VANKQQAVRTRVPPGKRKAEARIHDAAAAQQAMAQRSSEPLLSPRRMRLLTRLLVVLLTVMALALVFISPVFSVRRVIVTGLSHLTPEEALEVRARAGVTPRSNLFLTKTGRIAKEVERLPSVARVSISRKLPGTLEVTVIPRVPIASLQVGGARWELDGGGVVIRRSTKTKNLPEIRSATNVDVQPGVSLADSPVGGALTLLRLANGRQPLRIAKIDVDQRTDIWLNMQDTVAIRLGQAEDLPKKVALIRSIYADKPDIAAEVQSIDLTCPDAPACTPRDSTKGSP
jgi:cell division protein FtsQ